MKFKNKPTFIISFILILIFVFTSCENKKEQNTIDENVKPGENNSEVIKEITPQKIAGYYLDLTDGWYYDFELSKDEAYDGTFASGFDASYTTDEEKLKVKQLGNWKIENGEIKLYSQGTYQSSLWYCGDYVVDSLNYFHGKISSDENYEQTVLISKALQSGDSQIINLYNDGKMIMEIIRDDGKNDDNTSPLGKYEAFAGTYQKKDSKLICTINSSSQEFYIVDDGCAKWVYYKK